MTGSTATSWDLPVQALEQRVPMALIVSVDPWSNCPSEIAREEGRLYNECEFWGREVQGVDWSESSLCLFDGEREADSSAEDLC